jgi:hypothetical protein
VQPGNKDYSGLTAVSIQNMSDADKIYYTAVIKAAGIDSGSLNSMKYKNTAGISKIRNDAQTFGQENKVQFGYGLNKQNGNGCGCGNGLSKHPYKMMADGTFGKIKINPMNLNKMMLTVHKNGRRICHQPCNYDLIELLTKRYNTSRKYSPESMDIFNKLIKHAEMPITSVNSGKFKHIISKNQKAYGVDEEDEGMGIYVNNPPRRQQPVEQTDSVKIYSNPDEVSTRLNILVGQINAKNNNPAIVNEAAGLVDWLLKNGHIDDNDHEMLYKLIGIA